MRIMLNGESMEMCTEATVTELLQKRGVASADMVSVEVNEQILAKEQFATTVLQDSDNVEFFYFMGGGSFQYERYRPIL